MALIGLGGLITDKDFNKALNSGYSDLIGTGRASMLNRDLAILLKEGKSDQFKLFLEPGHPEKYLFPKVLWGMCLKGTEDWLPGVQKK